MAIYGYWPKSLLGEMVLDEMVMDKMGVDEMVIEHYYSSLCPKAEVSFVKLIFWGSTFGGKKHPKHFK